ncbi:MAG: YbjN domain-containing protein [Clostridia bacterium]|nr:YbjN domain-containing protein [Clostridia bacterium]
MADVAAAKDIFQSLCKMLDNRNWKYNKHEDELVVTCSVKGDDFNIDLIIRIIAENEVVSVISFMPFEIPEDKRVDMALAVCAANYGIVDGSFDYNIVNGSLFFRMTSSFKDTVLSEELLAYMIFVSSITVDKYNDKFFMIAKGMLSVDDFIKSEHQD